MPMQGAAQLLDVGLIRARGADAAKFLQGQLTNDVLTLDAMHARLAGFCSAKGRLQASFVVLRRSEDEFLLACPRDVLAPTLKRLSMFVLRAKCVLSEATGDFALWGVAGATAATWIDVLGVWQMRADAEHTVLRLPDVGATQRALVALPAAVAAGASAPGAELSLAAWNWLDVQSGIVRIVAATVDRFVPQMVNYELVGGVDFQKGCYPGQEVVARSQYRGTTKRRAFLFACDALAEPGQDVFVAAGPGEPVGTVAAAAKDPNGSGACALVEVRLAALDGDLRLGAADGPSLHRLPLPYAVPVEADAAA